jgi:hypothetical protein
VLGAVGAAVHDHHRPDAGYAWGLPEAAVLRGAITHLFRRLTDRAGWQLAYTDRGYDEARDAERLAMGAAARETVHWHAFSRWEHTLYEALDRPGFGDPLELLAGQLDTDRPRAAAVLQTQIPRLVLGSATIRWVEILVGENLLATCQRQPEDVVDNPRVGPLLARVLSRATAWEVWLELVRGAPLTGAATFPR